MPEGSSLTKQAATRGYGGRVLLQGKTLSETIEKAREMAGDGFTFIHPFDDRDIMAGQGTIGLEILQELPNPDWVIVPVGGGGLISGLAVAVKALSPGTRILGVQSAACPAVLRSLEQGAGVEVAPVRTIADGIAVRQPGRNTFPVMQALVDEFCLVEEDRIAEAILDLLEHKRILAEGAGAVPVAALKQLSGTLLRGRRVVLVISGGNLDLPVLDRVLRQGLLRQGRVARLTLQLDDVPGALAGLLSHVARLDGNILHIHHQRSEAGQDLFSTRVILELETRGPDHAVEIRESLAAAGFAVLDRPEA
jgi:threonine dehydratase